MSCSSIWKNSPIQNFVQYILSWLLDIDFNKGTYGDTEINGVGESAGVELKENANNSNDVNFTTPGDYSYDAAKIEISAGKAKLKAAIASFYNWPFTVSGDYNFNPAKIAVTGGVAKLSGVPLAPYAWWHLNETSGTNR